MAISKQFSGILLIVSFCTIGVAQQVPNEIPLEEIKKDSRVKNLIEVLEQADDNRDTAKVISITNDLMLQYALMQHLSRSHDLAKANLIRAQKWNDPCLIGSTLNYYGLIMGIHKDYERFTNTPKKDFYTWADSALYYHKSALAIGASDEDCEQLPRTWAYLGLLRTHYFIARMGHRDFNQALIYGDSALSNALRLNNLRTQGEAHVWIAHCYSMSGQYARAKSHIKRAYEIAQVRNNGFQGVFDVWYGTLAKESGNDSLLWLHAEILERVRNRVGEEMQSAIQDADIKYETAKKEQQLLLQEQQIKNRDQIILVILSGVVVVGILALYLYRLFKRNKRLSSRLELLLKEQNHRVKNNLQMINSLLSLQSQKLLSTDARNALNESQGRINSVALLHRMLYEGEELGIINTKQYLDNLIEEIGYTSGREVTWKIEIDPEIHVSVEKATSLGLIVNELITNSIKHVAQEIKLIIQLGVNKLNDDIELVYMDNGIGFDPEVWETSESFGNQLIRIQSDQLRGKFKVDNNLGFNYLLKIIA